MLAEELRNKLTEMMKQDPQAAIEELKKDPQLLKILLNSDRHLQQEKNEKIRYVNMTNEMQQKLKIQADRLQTTQGLLIGAGVLFLLSQLE